MRRTVLPMPIEIASEKAICFKCGTAYGRRKGYFPVSYAVQHKGVGYLPVCKTCVDTMYNTYLSQCKNAKDAVRQMCRKLDLYWSESIFEVVTRKTTERSMMTQYIAKINSVNYAGRSYDDTLAAEGSLWSFGSEHNDSQNPEQEDAVRVSSGSDDDVQMDDIPEDVITYWGPGYTPDMYQDLEQRRTYWVNNLPDGIVMDVGMEARIRQICNLELDINRMRAKGKATDKLSAQLSKLISDMNLDPASRGDDNSEFNKTPFGVWIDRWENKRPIPEPDPELEDTDHIVKYVSTWLLGHLCAMFGIKNKNTKLYEDAIEELRVERKVADEDDDEEVFNLVFPSESGDSG